MSLPSTSVPTTESGERTTGVPITLRVGIPNSVVLIWKVIGADFWSHLAKNTSTAVKNAPSISSFVSISDGASMLPPTTNVWARGS